MTFGEKLKLLRKEKKLSQQELAKILGTSKQVISRYELGQTTPKIGVAARWCEVLGLNLDNMLNNSRGIYDKSAQSQDRPLPSNIMPPPRMVKKPLLGTIACGTPILAVENIEEEVGVPEGVQCDFVLRCRGDSMIDARIYDGDLVYLRQQEEVENGEIAAVLIEDGCEREATLKRVYLAAERITLFPANPRYEPLVFIREEMNRVRIIGKAVAFTSTVR